jgi:hypothetical protein
MRNAFLEGRRIAISISDTSDMGVRGLGKEHLEDAMAEIARHLLAWGAQLAYGGDLRPGGFTELLFELVNRYRRNEHVEADRDQKFPRLAGSRVHAMVNRRQVADGP